MKSYSASMSDTPVAFTALVQRFQAIPDDTRLVAAYECIRDIAYGDIGSRNPFDVLAAQKGTCSGKHALLQLLLIELGYDVESWFALHDFGRFPITPWPDALVEFHGKHIPDYHDFLKVNVDGTWLTIDAVFDAPLVALGFPMLQWDGGTNMKLPVDASEIFQANGDMENHKKRLIAALPAEVQAQRKAFLGAMTAWLDTARAS